VTGGLVDPSLGGDLETGQSTGSLIVMSGIDHLDSSLVGEMSTSFVREMPLLVGLANQDKV
jgi:hypothetical protein